MTVDQAIQIIAEATEAHKQVPTDVLAHAAAVLALAAYTKVSGPDA